jgi:hypothetical protein
MAGIAAMKSSKIISIHQNAYEEQKNKRQFSVSDPEPDPHSMTAWIRIRIPNVDPDPGGIKRTTMKGKAQPKDR